MDNSPKALVALFFLLLGLGAKAQMALETPPANPVVDTSRNGDIDAPRTDLLQTHAGGFVYGPATRLKFKIIEEGSGLETTYFKVDNMPYMQTDGRQMMPHELADGEYTMLYYSTDKAGNQEQLRTDVVYIDKNGPKVHASFSAAADSFEDGTPVFPKGVQLLVEIADERVEVQKVTYTINGGAKMEGSNVSSLDLTKEIAAADSRMIKIEVTAYDTFYNISKETIEFKVQR